MKYTLLLFLTIATITVNGQNHFVGIQSGVNYTRVINDHFPKNKVNFRTGLVIGITYDYQFKKNFSIGSGIIYNQRGYTRDIVFSPTYTGEPNDLIFIYKVNRDFISLPLKIGFNCGKELFAYGNIGLTPSVLVEAYDVHPKLDFNGNDLPERSVWNKDLVYKFDIGGLAEVGGGYKFTNHFWLYSSLLFQHSFAPIFNYDRSPDAEIIHYGWSLSLGFKYALTKE
ncbi:MAG TPA: hypothetical protein DIW47_02765 [Bacteroidetes bacterium]|nr:hypothetical protein [Bacteroidota bacterium]